MPPLFDFLNQVEDEIALEGLDGITLQGNCAKYLLICADVLCRVRFC